MLYATHGIFLGRNQSLYTQKVSMEFPIDVTVLLQTTKVFDGKTPQVTESYILFLATIINNPSSTSHASLLNHSHSHLSQFYISSHHSLQIITLYMNVFTNVFSKPTIKMTRLFLLHQSPFDMRISYHSQVLQT